MSGLRWRDADVAILVVLSLIATESILRVASTLSPPVSLLLSKSPAIPLELPFHGVSPKHLPRHLDEFVFRFDRRWQETELFIRVLHRALDTAPLPNHRLTTERIG